MKIGRLVNWPATNDVSKDVRGRDESELRGGGGGLGSSWEI